MGAARFVTRRAACALGLWSAACGSSELGEGAPVSAEATQAVITPWQDTWARSDPDVAGFCTSGDECIRSADLSKHHGAVCDAGTARWRTSRPVHGICDLPGTNRCLATDAANQLLYFHGEDLWNNGLGGEGFPLYSAQTFDRTQYISLEVAMRAYCGPAASAGCFAGVALYNGEDNYRELGYVGSGGALSLWRYAGNACNPNQLVASVAPNTFHKLRLDYFGEDGGKWVYYIDDVVRQIENVDQLGARLIEDPRVAFIFAGNGFGAYTEGSLQPVRVWTGGTSSQAQTARADGFGVTSAIRYAQEILSPGANPTRVRLFFGANGQQFVVSAFTDNAGVPGTLINEAAYTADRAGFQDVPLWVPGSSFPKIWLVVRGQTATMADLGTSAPNTDPYAGRLLVSGNAGATWSTVNRDLYFVLYNR